MGSGDTYWEKSLKAFIADKVFQDVNKVFQDEPIAPKPKKPTEKLPPLLEAARSLEKGPSLSYSKLQKLFLKQARLLVNYVDDYPIIKAFTWGVPTYQELSNQELRSYFSWRTKVRQGNVQECCIAYAFLYLFELMNHVGVPYAEDGLQMMDSFVNAYGKLNGEILYYYSNWRISYIFYYNLPDELLKEDGSLFSEEETCLDILDSAPEQSDEDIMKAAAALSGWLKRSGFYKKNSEDMNRVISRVLRRMAARYRSRNQRDLTEQLFGPSQANYFPLFHHAVFCLSNKWRDGTHYLSKKHYFRLENGLCTEVKRNLAPHGQKKLEALMKYIDNEMRIASGGKGLQVDGQNKWISKIIQEEIQVLQDEKKATRIPKLSIDYKALNRIRQDAAVTQEKLRIEDEMEEEPAPPASAPASAAPEPESGDCPLNADERRLLHGLLYGEDTSWVQREGKLLSVLLDSINEKLYDSFQDSVLEDGGVVEDYLDELKEIIKP